MFKKFITSLIKRDGIKAVINKIVGTIKKTPNVIYWKIVLINA